MNKNNKIWNNEVGQELYLKFLGTEYFDKNTGDTKRPLKARTVKAIMEASVQNKDASIVSEMIEAQWASGGRVLFWSDQHFGHSNIIKYANRKFNNVDEMNAAMMKNYRAHVKQDDIVVFGGDVSFGNLNSVKYELKSLPGRKVLVLGNHEIDRSGFRDHEAFEHVVMSLALNYKGVEVSGNILVSHVPLMLDWLPKNTLNVHGHIHDELAGERRINMAVEHTDYTPKDLKDIFEINFSQM